MVQRGEGLVVGGDVGLQWVVRVGGHRVVGGLEQGIGGKRVEGRGAIFVASGLKSSTLVYYHGLVFVLKNVDVIEMSAKEKGQVKQ